MKRELIKKRVEYFRSKGYNRKRMISFILTLIADIIIWTGFLCFMIFGIIESKTYKDLLTFSISEYLFLCIIPVIGVLIGIGGWIIFKPKNALKSLGISTIAIVSLMFAILTIWTSIEAFSINFQWNGENGVSQRISYEKNNKCCFYHSTIENENNSNSNEKNKKYSKIEIFSDCPYFTNFTIKENSCQKTGITEYCEIDLNQINENNQNLFCERYLESNPFALIGVFSCEVFYMARSLCLLFILMCKQRKRIMKNLRETHENGNITATENNGNEINMSNELQSVIVNEE